MQTIIFFNSIPFWGGGEKLHLEYAEKFLEKGYRVVFFIRKNSELDKRAKDARFIKEYIQLGKFSFLNLFTLQKLKSRLGNFNPACIIFSVSQDMKAVGLSYRAHAKLVYLRGLAVPVKNTLLNRFLFYKCITHFAMNSNETERCTLGNFDREKIKGKIKVIYHGIDLNEYSAVRLNNKEFRAGFKGILIGNAGRLTAQKAQEDLIKVAVILKKRNLNFKILIAGTGTLAGDLLKSIRENGVEDCVSLAGFITDMPAFLASIDVFVLSSHWEGFGYVLVESMALAKPVVAYDISSNPEIVNHGVNGYLSPLGDIEKLAENLESLIIDEQKRISMGQIGREIAETRFEINNRVNEFEEFILS